jgi:DNA polymerase-3 subunit gamma/tau
LIESVKNSSIYKDILKSFPDAELFDVKPRKED